MIMMNISRRMTSVALLLLAAATGAVADNLLWLKSYDLSPREEAVLSVCLTNAEPVSVMQFDITLPAGMTLKDDVATSVIKTDRCLCDVRMTRYAGDAEKYVVVLASPDLLSISPLAEGADATILQLAVKASEDYSVFTNVDFGHVIGIDADDNSIVEVGVPTDDESAPTTEFGNQQTKPIEPEKAEEIQTETPHYAMVDLSEGSEAAESVKAVVEELNRKIANQEISRNEAIAELDSHMEYLEKKEGDVNLDGQFDNDDVVKSFTDIKVEEKGFDYNDDGVFNIRDTNALYKKVINSER